MSAERKRKNHPIGGLFHPDLGGGARLSDYAQFNYKVDGQKTRITKEVNGANWLVVDRDGLQVITIEAFDRILSFTSLEPIFNASFVRGSGNLALVGFSMFDMVSKDKNFLLESSDRERIEALRKFGFQWIGIISWVEGVVAPVLKTTLISSKEQKSEVIDLSDPSSVGHIHGWADYKWKSNFSVLKEKGGLDIGGKFGFEIFEDKVVFYYETGEEDDLERVEVLRVTRQLTAFSAFERLVNNKMPNVADLEGFVREIFMTKPE